MCQVLTLCGFYRVSPDGNCAYVHWGSFTSSSRSVRRAIWYTWFSEPHECSCNLLIFSSFLNHGTILTSTIFSNSLYNTDRRVIISVRLSFTDWFLFPVLGIWMIIPRLKQSGICSMVTIVLKITLTSCIALTLSSLNLLSSSSTTSRKLLSQFPTCSGWRWAKWVKIKENCHESV